jgi:K+-transporting ATPase ATPase A chain
MLIGRFGTLIVILAIAGGLVRQPRNDRSAGSLSPATWFFGVLLAATALIVTALTYLPADALGPVAEALLLRRHGSF